VRGVKKIVYESAQIFHPVNIVCACGGIIRPSGAVLAAWRIICKCAPTCADKIIFDSTPRSSADYVFMRRFYSTRSRL